MGREVRMVPADWQHPKEVNLRTGSEYYTPLLQGGYEDDVKEWEDEHLPEWIEGAKLWAIGQVKTWDGKIKTIAEVVQETSARERPARPEDATYAWYAGDVPRRPDPAHYMPNWPDEQRTHFMMYEDTTEGTPISPAFATAEELARWLADTSVSAFAGDGATYEQWLAMIGRGSSISAVLNGATGEFISGVAAGV